MEKIVQLVSKVLGLLIPYLKKDDSKFGVKETKEVIVAINEIGVIIARLLKDGAQGSDLVSFYAAVMGSQDMKDKIADAYLNFKALPEEIVDLDLGEGAELLKLQVEYLPLYIEELKK
jgi:hypothetical protein